MRLISIAVGIGDETVAGLLALDEAKARRLVIRSGEPRPPAGNGHADLVFLPPVPAAAALRSHDIDAVVDGLDRQCGAPGLVAVEHAAAPTFVRLCQECALPAALARSGVKAVFTAPPAAYDGWAALVQRLASLIRNSAAVLNVLQPSREPLAPAKELALREASAMLKVRPVAAPTPAALATLRDARSLAEGGPASAAWVISEAARFRAELFAPHAVPFARGSVEARASMGQELDTSSLSTAASETRPSSSGRGPRVIPTFRGPVTVAHPGTLGVPLVPTSALDAETGRFESVLVHLRDSDDVADFWAGAVPFTWRAGQSRSAASWP